VRDYLNGTTWVNHHTWVNHNTWWSMQNCHFLLSAPHLGLGWTSTHINTMVKIPEFFWRLVASNHGKYYPIMIQEAEGTTCVDPGSPWPCTLADSTTTTLVIVLMDPSHSCGPSVLSLFSYTFVDVRNDIKIITSIILMHLYSCSSYVQLKPILSLSSWILIHVDVTFNVNSFIPFIVLVHFLFMPIWFWHEFISSSHCPYT
jgi:hypothetical protein